MIGSGKVTVVAGAGGGAFDAPPNFILPQNGGMVTAQLSERMSDGSIVANGVDLFVQSQVHWMCARSISGSTSTHHYLAQLSAAR